MAQTLPLVLVPGLLCSARLYASQIAALWPFGQVAVADHRRDADIAQLAGRILGDAPPHFALAGLSFGGFIVFEMMRQAPARIRKLALLDTSARPDTSEQIAMRKTHIAVTQSGRFSEMTDMAIQRYLHRNRQRDPEMTGIVHQMAADIGPEAFIRQVHAILSRPDSRPLLASIRCPTLVLVGDGDEATPPDLSKEIAAGIPGARLTIVPDCGHLSTLEKPEAVNAALAQWLAA